MAEANLNNDLLLTTEGKFIISVNNEEEQVIGVEDLDYFVYGVIKSSVTVEDVVISVINEEDDSLVARVLTYANGLYIVKDLNPTTTYRIEYVDVDPDVPKTVIGEGIVPEPDGVVLPSKTLKTPNEIIRGKITSYQPDFNDLKLVNCRLINKATGEEVERTISDEDGLFIFKENVSQGIVYEVEVQKIGSFFKVGINDAFLTTVRQDVTSGNVSIEFLMAPAVYDITANLSREMQQQFTLKNSKGEIVKNLASSTKGIISMNAMVIGGYVLEPQESQRWTFDPTEYIFSVDGTGNQELGTIFTVTQKQTKFKISGIVNEIEESGNASGYLIILSDGTVDSYSTTTNEDGYWEISDVVAGVTYTLTANKATRVITKGNQAKVYENFSISSDVTGYDFNSSPITGPTIIGNIYYDNLIENTFSPDITGNPQGISSEFFVNNTFSIKIKNIFGSTLETITPTTSLWTSSEDFLNEKDFNIEIIPPEGYEVIGNSTVEKKFANGITGIVDFTFRTSEANKMKVTIQPAFEGKWVNLYIFDLGDVSLYDTKTTNANGEVEFAGIINSGYYIEVLDPLNNFSLIGVDEFFIEDDVADRIMQVELDELVIDEKGSIHVVGEYEPSNDIEATLIFYRGTTFENAFNVNTEKTEQIEVPSDPVTLETKKYETGGILFENLEPGSYTVVIKYISSSVTGESVEGAEIGGTETYIIQLGQEMLGEPAAESNEQLITFKQPIHSYGEFDLSFPINYPVGVDFQVLKAGTTEIVANDTKMFEHNIEDGLVEFSSFVNIAEATTQVLTRLQNNTSYVLLYNFFLRNGAKTQNATQEISVNEDTVEIVLGSESDFTESTYIFKRKIELQMTSDFLHFINPTSMSVTKGSNSIPIVKFDMNASDNEAFVPQKGFSLANILEKTGSAKLSMYIPNITEVYTIKFPHSIAGNPSISIKVGNKTPLNYNNLATGVSIQIPNTDIDSSNVIIFDKSI
jgi:hypothetical protein